MGTQPKEQTSVGLRTVAGTLAAATPALLLAANKGRKYLLVQNVGAVNPLTLGFGAAPAAGAGIGLDPALSAGGQGGSYEQVDVVSTDAIYAISTGGTDYVAIEG